MCVDCSENSSILPKGDPGTNGNDGAAGTNGSNMRTGNGVPSSSLGADSDTYLDIGTYNLYSKVSGAWVLIGNIKGADGSGLIKLAFTKSYSSISAGTVTETITSSFLSTYGLLTASTPGSASPPTSYTYGNSDADFLLFAYYYDDVSAKWLKIADNRVSISVDDGTNDITITVTGLAYSAADIRYVLIG